MIGIMSLHSKMFTIALQRIIVKSFLPSSLILYSARTGHNITCFNMGFIISVLNCGDFFWLILCFHFSIMLSLAPKVLC